MNGWNTRHRRVEWLRQHPEALTMTRQQLVGEMKQAGLLAPSTSPIDVNLKDSLLAAGYAADESARFAK